MKKEYIIRITKNGYIVRFNHLKFSFQEENLMVAKTLNEVVDIIQEDILAKEVVDK